MEKRTKELLRLHGQNKDDFCQSKYMYYKEFNLWGMTASCFAFIILVAVDAKAYGYLNAECFLRRMLVLIPMAALATAGRKTNNYKIMSVISCIVAHAIIWDSIWINSLLPDRSHVDVNFLFMDFILLIVSYCIPYRYAFIAQWGIVWDLIVANNIFHYYDFDLMIIYNCQVILMLNIVSFIVTKLYYDHYVDNNKLSLLSFYDPLTQVFNRNKLDEITDLNHDLSSISKDICIFIIDIDHFKIVNDTYGHDKGDFVLQFIANHITNSLRKQDVVIRWGGEEFVAILPNCKPDQAYLIAERMRTEIEESNNGLCKITVSIGVAKYDGSDCTDTIKKADLALYQAKQEGRNRTKQFED